MYCVVQAKQGAWYHGEDCRAVDAELARVAAGGLQPVQPDLPPHAWQLIRGTAVSAPKVQPMHNPFEVPVNRSVHD